MNQIEFENGTFNVDAALIAAGFGLDPAVIQAHMRDGTLTSLCEQGHDDDAGRYRLTFFYAQRCLRLVVDQAGTIIERSIDDRVDKPTTPAWHKMIRLDRH